MLSKMRPFQDQIWRDLYNRGLVKDVDLDRRANVESLKNRRSTDRGRQFLEFLDEATTTD